MTILSNFVAFLENINFTNLAQALFLSQNQRCGMFFKVDLKREPGFDPISFTFSENSNHVRERYKGTTMLGIVNKLLKTKSLLTSPSNVLP